MKRKEKRYKKQTDVRKKTSKMKNKGIEAISKEKYRIDKKTDKKKKKSEDMMKAKKTDIKLLIIKMMKRRNIINSKKKIKLKEERKK